MQLSISPMRLAFQKSITEMHTHKRSRPIKETSEKMRISDNVSVLSRRHNTGGACKTCGDKAVRHSANAKQPGHKHDGQSHKGAYRPRRTHQQDCRLPAAVLKQLSRLPTCLRLSRQKAVCDMPQRLATAAEISLCRPNTQSSSC